MTSAVLPTAPSVQPGGPESNTAQRDALRAQAEQLEAFLFAELLKVSGATTPSATGGQPSQFESFLRQHQAEAVAASGQTGLAESIYRSMTRGLG